MEWATRATHYLDWLWDDSMRANRFGTLRQSCPDQPSFYLQRQCAITPSTPSETEVSQIHSSPMPIMLGMDFPHRGSVWEGTSGYLGRLLSASSLGDEAFRGFAGVTACHVYGLDCDALRTIGETFGLQTEDLLTAASCEPLSDSAVRALARPSRV